MANKKTFTPKISEEDSMPETDASMEFLNFFVDELKDIYGAEKQLAKTLSKMRKAVTDNELKEAFESYLSSTLVHEERLEQVFELLGESARVKKSEAMAGLLEEVNEIIEKKDKGGVLKKKTALVLAAQKVEHYETVAYEGLVELARKMGNEDIISLLEETLSEEIKTGELLTALAETITSAPAAKEAKDDQQEEDNEEAGTVYDSVNLTRKINK